MRVMLMIKGDPESGARPSDELLAAMGKYNDELKEAGVLVDLAGLYPSGASRITSPCSRGSWLAHRMLAAMRWRSETISGHRLAGVPRGDLVLAQEFGDVLVGEPDGLAADAVVTDLLVLDQATNVALTPADVRRDERHIMQGVVLLLGGAVDGYPQRIRRASQPSTNPSIRGTCIPVADGTLSDRSCPGFSRVLVHDWRGRSVGARYVGLAARW